MKKGKWSLIVVGIAFIGSLLLVENGQAESEKSIPEQIAELKTLISNQQKEIASVKDTVSQLGTDNTDSTRAKGVLTISVNDVTSGLNDGVTNIPTKYTPIAGGKVTVMDSQGKKWTGTVNTQGTCSFTLPEGIYSVRLEDSTNYFSDDWQLTTVSTEKPITINFEHSDV
ncbi:hypothetical protein J7J00_00135 [Bacillus sp. ISL-4]|uniref:hypothetical protein n=1 Tax=Bacillus sp. ISL-4 TaxID=2819125 RepID=UPI001BE9E1A2|nr:hypothetical protein [Bacillus sp. ISL-4]MBT2663922.1 hypothetical protein [Bacillus sp. ISL-4]MBT2673503.1 hypothetical protein [Streptomyces sp. ISL-14]